VLDLVMTAIGEEDRVPSATLLDGVNVFLTRYEAVYNRARLIHAIRNSGPDKIQRNSESMKSLMGGNITTACGRVLLSLYNAKLQTRRLPEWDTISPHEASAKTRQSKASKKAEGAKA
jgi:hypothetical protein